MALAAIKEEYVLLKFKCCFFLVLFFASWESEVA